MFLRNLSEWTHKNLGVPYILSVPYNIGSGETIILLHGIASDSKTWQPLLPLISPMYHCIAIDLLGFGSSPKPTWSNYSIEQHMKSIHRTIHALHLSGQFIVVGHSMGSLLAAHYARLYPKEVKQVVMLSPPIMTNLSESKKSRLIFSTTAYARAYRYIREHKKFTISGVAHIRRILKNAPFDISEEIWVPFVKSLEECIEKQATIDDLVHLLCPIDIFYGTRDRVISVANIQTLPHLKNVTLYHINSWHRVNARYAQYVADELIRTIS